MAEKLVKLIKEIGKIPDLKNAVIKKVESSIIHVEGTWRFKNYSNNEGNVLHTSYACEVNSRKIQVFPSTIQDKRIISSATSPNCSKSAYLLQDDEVCYINIVSEEGQSISVNLKDLDLHGKIYNDSTLSSFCWSNDSKSIAFVAEKKTPKRISYMSKKTESNADGWGEKYSYLDDWGEQMEGMCESVIVVVDTNSEDVKVLTLPDDLCGGQVVWGPQGTLVGVAFVTKPFKLGLIYCKNRESVLFQMDVEGKFAELTERGHHVEAPRFSPDGSKLIFLQCPVGGPHIRSVQLRIMKWLERESSVVVDLVEKEVKITNDDTFMGLCGASVLPLNCWSKDNQRVVFSAADNFAFRTYIVNTESKQIRQLEAEGNLLALDVKEDFILASLSSLTEPTRICLTSINSDMKKDDMIFLSHPHTVDGIPKDWQSEWTCKRQSDEAISPIPVIYFGPTETSPSTPKRPLIVWVHGGPHILIRNEFIPTASFLVRLGFSVLFPNYRGSLGQGKLALESLPGHVGTADVRDVYEATIQCLQKFDSILDKSKVVLFGGSHGGFLVTHLAAQYPELYKVVSTRNPVIDIGSMSTSTDIPDWTFVESGLEYKIGQTMSGEIISRMFKMSPLNLVDQMKAPTLLLLGTKDRRVPMSQGLFYHKMLLARNIETKLCVYEDSHALCKIDVEADVLVQTALWYQKHL